MRQTSRSGGNHGKATTGQQTRRNSGGPVGRRLPVHVAAASLDDTPPPARVGWRQAIDDTVAGLGYQLVDVERAPRGLLRVTIDRMPGRAYAAPSEFVLVEDCEQVTRQLQYVLEVEGLDYARLEVSSPGLDRPLKSEADFERFTGQAVNVVLKVPFQGRKSWQGVLGRAPLPAAADAETAVAAGTDDPSRDAGGWSLVFKHGKAEQVMTFSFDEVRDARLVPVVDFKGRKSGSANGAAVDGGQADVNAEQRANPAAASGVDGG